tara:strand:+ start:4853 stop:5098 length:246 start_codon:yes stop_codon:yes gene_type:complete
MEACPDNLSPCENYEHTCGKCGKTFLYQVEYEISYSTWEAPCLNGGEHQYKPVTGYPPEYFEGRERCKICDDEITTKEEGK